jgi:hypothetical protein
LRSLDQYIAERIGHLTRFPSLSDCTMALSGSNMDNANSQVTTDLPVIFAGGGFRHGQHLAFDTEHNYPLPNLYVSMLQQLGIETARFASSTGTMRGLMWRDTGILACSSIFSENTKEARRNAHIAWVLIISARF